MLRLKNIFVYEDQIKYSLLDDSFIPNEIIVRELPDNLSNIRYIGNEATYGKEVTQIEGLPKVVFDNLAPAQPDIKFTILCELLSNIKDLEVIYEGDKIPLNRLYLFQYENAIGYKNERFISVINDQVYINYDKFLYKGKPIEEIINKGLHEIDDETTRERIDAYTVLNRYFKYAQYDQIIRGMDKSLGAEFKNGNKTSGVLYLEYEMEGIPLVIENNEDSIEDLLNERIYNAIITLIYKRLYTSYKIDTLEKKATPKGYLKMEVQ